MYNDHFKLSRLPFENTLDQRFLFMSQCHKEVIAALLYFVREKKSFAMVCGDAGAGKTMAVHYFLGKLPPSVQPILIPYPDADYIETLRFIARALGIGAENKSVLELSDALRAALSKANSEGKQVVLVIDEAHILPVASLENIRLLSNIELPESKLLQIVLIGQNELALKLRKPELRQLRQRININRVLSPMTPEETTGYIDYRLKIAGSSFQACFEPDCSKLVYAITGGVPRNINRLCDTALLICMAHECRKVTKKILKKARAALDTDSIVTAQEPSPGPVSRFKKLWPAFVAAAILLLALGFFGYARHNFRRRPKASVPAVPAQKKLAVPLPNRKVQTPAVKAHHHPSSKAAINPSPAPAPAPGENPAPSPPQIISNQPQRAAKSAPAAPEFILIRVRKGDSLSRIAEKWFPQDPAAGLKAIVAANPQVNDKNLILIGQTLKIPKSDQ